jgi:tetratricopeptide (TPR) repeat protein
MRAATIGILHSGPLVWRDSDGGIHAVDTLDFRAELAVLLESFSEAGRALEFRVENATTDKLRTFVTLGIEILHYSGHGHPDFLAFEDETASMHAVAPAALQTLLAAGGSSSIRLAFVSACHSRNTAQAFVNAEIPHVIGVRLETPVFDRAASAFARAFYLALAAGKTVKESFEIGKASVSAMPGLVDPVSESGKFLLLPEYGNHDVAILSELPEGQWCDRSRPPVPGNVPAVPQHFLGRHAEMQSLVRDIKQERLTTIRGAPGIGKTAIAIAVSDYVKERRAFSDGVFFVSLRGARSLEAVRFAISKAVGIEAANDSDLIEALAKRQFLLVLDNCEDPLASQPTKLRQFTLALLQRARNATILVTTRQAFGGLPGIAEKVHHLGRLDVLDAAKLLSLLSPRPLRIAEISAEQGEEPLRALSRHSVLSFLAGHPHAISLAAPLLLDRTLDELNQLLLEHRVSALSVQGIPEDERDAVTSLVKSYELSVDNLRSRVPESIRLFGLLGLLPSGVLDQVLDKLWPGDWRPLMADLVSASLIERSVVMGAAHYITFPFIVTFASELLTEDDRKYFEARIILAYAGLGRFLYRNVATPSNSVVAALFAAQELNFWACLEPGRAVPSSDSEIHAVTPTGHIATYLPELLKFALRIHDGTRAAILGREACQRVGDRMAESHVIKILGDLREIMHDLDAAGSLYEESLQMARDLGNKLGEANTLVTLGRLGLRTDDLSVAKECAESALVIFRQIGEPHGEGNSLELLGDIAIRRNQPSEACDHLEAAIRATRTIGHKLGEANALMSLADAKSRIYERKQEAEADLELALEIYASIGSRNGEASALHQRSNLRFALGDFDGSLKDAELSLTICREWQLTLTEANCLRTIADIKLRQEKVAEAQKSGSEALAIYRAISDRLGEGNSLRVLGDVSRQQNDLSRALELYAASLLIANEIDDRTMQAQSLSGCGLAFWEQGNIVEARVQLGRAREICESSGDLRACAGICELLAAIAVSAGEEPTDLLDAAYEIFVALDDAVSQTRVEELRSGGLQSRENTAAPALRAPTKEEDDPTAPL